MTDWYKMDPVAWNDGTDALTLEQEAALLRICNAIHIHERPLRNNMFVIAGLLRCNERKAKRILDELVAAGKIVIEGDTISNPRAIHDVSDRLRGRVRSQSNGSQGGLESGKARAKPLKTNKSSQAFASPSSEPEEIRKEETRLLGPSRFQNPTIILQSEVDPMTAKNFTNHCEQKGKRLSAQTAEALVDGLRGIRAAGGDPTEALQLAMRKGWVTFELEWLRKAGMKFGSPSAQDRAQVVGSWPPEKWQPMLDNFRDTGQWNQSALGPPPGQPDCLVPPALIAAK